MEQELIQKSTVLVFAHHLTASSKSHHLKQYKVVGHSMPYITAHTYTPPFQLQMSQEGTT